MTSDKKGAKAFEKLLIALERQSQDDNFRNTEWVRLWSRVADYDSFVSKKKKL